MRAVRVDNVTIMSGATMKAIFLRLQGVLVVCSWLVVSGGCSRASASQQMDMLSSTYDIVVKDCRQQIEAQRFDACLEALDELSKRLSGSTGGTESDLKAQIGYFMTMVEAYKAAGELNPERPSDYYNTIFSAMARIPEKYFPYQDALPLWNRYLREDAGRARFKRYRRLRVTIRAQDKANKPLEDELFRAMQPLVLAYGYSIIDPTSSLSTNPDSFLKVAIEGTPVHDSTDPRLQHQKIYRLTMDIQSFKFLTARKKVAPQEIEIETAAGSEAEAKKQAIQQSAERLTNLLFYYSLKNMFAAP